MRVLLDECVNQRLRNCLPGHECESAEYAGFAGLKNGELLDAAGLPDITLVKDCVRWLIVAVR